jgi:NADH-quinone oxidoreductase subunit H
MSEPAWVQIVKALIIVFVVITVFAYLVLIERRALGRFQARPGPNRAGPAGVWQPLADVIKLIFKEDFVPNTADRFIYTIAPVIAVAAAVTGIALIPFGDPITVDGTEIKLVGADPSVGLLLLFALSGIGFYGLILGGWASGSKYSVLGSARTAAQLVSYEVAMGLSVVGVVVLSQSLNLTEIVDAQRETAWYVLFQPVGFLIFLVAMVAEVNRAPFDLPEAEGELVAGYHTEYGGLKFAMFQTAEYINLLVISGLAATLFLGGFAGPWLSGVWWLALKMGVLVFGFIWLRATMPRLRYDQLMKFGWKILLPVATANLLVTVIVVGIAFQN